jgi:CRISPR type III-B/RAMP module RAMP protein Cmr6
MTSEALRATLQTDWRLVTGVGRNTPYEVGFHFNRYGVACLPGSALKGVARSYALVQLADAIAAKDLNELEEYILKDDRAFNEAWAHPTQKDEALAFRGIFGHTQAAGGAIFYDAMPIGVPKLELDVLNPHYPDYYQGDSPPTQWQSPVPVFFLTVAAGTSFQFAVGWRSAVNTDLHSKAMSWLLRGLTELGAGAKTNAGYGYFAQIENDLAQQNPNAGIGVLATATESPQQQPLKQSKGRFNRKGNQFTITDEAGEHKVMKQRLGDQAYNNLPGDATTVIYFYDEWDVNGSVQRRVWRVVKVGKQVIK